jgi:hypothetical protein
MRAAGGGCRFQHSLSFISATDVMKRGKAAAKHAIKTHDRERIPEIFVSRPVIDAAPTNSQAVKTLAKQIDAASNISRQRRALDQ